MQKDRIEKRIGRVIAWRVFTQFETHSTNERLRLARVGKQAVKSNRPNLNHAAIAIETDLALQRREGALTANIERQAWQILGDWNND